MENRTAKEIASDWLCFHRGVGDCGPDPEELNIDGVSEALDDILDAETHSDQPHDEIRSAFKNYRDGTFRIELLEKIEDAWGRTPKMGLEKECNIILDSLITGESNFILLARDSSDHGWYSWALESHDRNSAHEEAVLILDDMARECWACEFPRDSNESEAFIVDREMDMLEGVSEITDRNLEL